MRAKGKKTLVGITRHMTVRPSWMMAPDWWGCQVRKAREVRKQMESFYDEEKQVVIRTLRGFVARGPVIGQTVGGVLMTL